MLKGMLRIFLMPSSACEQAASWDSGLYHNDIVRSDRAVYFTLCDPGNGRVLHRVLAERYCAYGAGASGQPDWIAGSRQFSSETSGWRVSFRRRIHLLTIKCATAVVGKTMAAIFLLEE